MKTGLLKKFFSSVLILVFMTTSLQLRAQDDGGSSGGIVDDSLRDITVVLGTGAAGAILGLSTLSFVEVPKDHLKNIAIGGAIGVVVGVGIVVYSQATKSSSAITADIWRAPMNSDKVASLAREEFIQEKIAKDYLKVPTIGYNFSF